MKQRTGDWRDVLSAYSLALDAKKLWMGFLAVMVTVAVMFAASFAYGKILGTDAVGEFASRQTTSHVLEPFLQGRGLAAASVLLPLLNPFHAGIVHFLFSVVFYSLVLTIWSYFGGVITRLAALEYGRDDFPMLADGTRMVCARWKAYWLTPLVPLIGVVLFALLNALGGLIGSIPYAGPILMIAGIVPWFISTGILVFLVGLGVLSFGLMLPTVSIGGKDAFEGWSSAFSYAVWGFKRFVGYAVICVLVGIVSTVVVWAVCELFIYALVQTINFGLLAEGGLVRYSAFAGGQFGPALSLTASGSVLMGISSVCMLAALLGVRAIPVAYVFAYFFSSNTVICFLLRKHVHKIEIDEVYEEQPEEEAAPAPEEPGAPEEQAEEAEPEAGPDVEMIVEEEAEQTGEKETPEQLEDESTGQDSPEEAEEQ